MEVAKAFVAFMRRRYGLLAKCDVLSTFRKM
jgi:hypothetical protein